jgi:hypothetical protein
MKKLLFATVLAAAALFPTSAFAGTFSGVVVGKGGGNLAVAGKGGLVRTVHSGAAVRVGARVRVNGLRVRVVGLAHRARVHGVVLRRVGTTTFLAAGRSLVAVRSPSGRRLAGIAPSAGTVVNANVAIAGSKLTQHSLQVVGRDDRVTIQAPVTAVGPGSITVAVNGQPLTIRLPAGIQLPASLVGQTVSLTIRVEDENEIEIEDENEIENENEDHHNRGPGGGDDHGDHSGPGRGGGDDD